MRLMVVMPPLMKEDSTIDPAAETYRKPPYFDQVFPRNIPADLNLREALASQYEVDPMEPHNQAMLIHTSLISGRPGYDFSNPFAWIGRLTFNKASLIPNYGGAMQDGTLIANNIAASSGLIKKRLGAGYG